MQRTLKDIMTEFLTIVGYPNDKEKFVKEFEELNQIETLANIVETLPKEEQEKIKTSNADEIDKYISKEAYAKELTKVSSLAFAEQIKETLPLINPDQKEKIIQLLSDLQASQEQTSTPSTE